MENMEVAVKMAHQGILAAAEKDPAIVEQFKKEVKFMCTLEHPNVCDCFGAVTHYADGDLCMWILMEKLEMDLDVAISDKRVPLGRDAPQQYAALLHGIVRALAYFHSPNDGKPIVHRDLKPANIMLDRNNVPKVIDFGQAKETLAGIGSTMGMKGTPQWWAPEQRANGVCVCVCVCVRLSVCLSVCDLSVCAGDDYSLTEHTHTCAHYRTVSASLPT